jgi:hypothetical protein
VIPSNGASHIHEGLELQNPFPSLPTYYPTTGPAIVPSPPLFLSLFLLVSVSVSLSPKVFVGIDPNADITTELTMQQLLFPSVGAAYDSLVEKGYRAAIAWSGSYNVLV